MIRVRKPLKAPKILTTKGAEQTNKDRVAYDLRSSDYRSGLEKFEFKDHIYNAKSVKNALLKAQYKKCCYCESKFSSTSYGAVEHFRPKRGVKQKKSQTLQYPGYYWLVYDWDNLLVSCERCNSSHKGNLFPLAVQKRRARSHHDDVTEERALFIDPAREDPRPSYPFSWRSAIRHHEEGPRDHPGNGLEET